MTEFKHELGVEVKDVVTGFKGIVAGRTEHITGCNTYSVQPKIDKGGLVGDCRFFDEDALEVVSRGVATKMKKKMEKAVKPGGLVKPVKTK